MSGDIDRGSNPRGGSTRFSLARGNGACARHVLVQPGPRRKGRRGKTQYDPGRPRGNDTFTRLKNNSLPPRTSSRGQSIAISRRSPRIESISTRHHRVSVDIESASIPFCARQTPVSYYPATFCPCPRWYPLDTPRHVGSSSFFRLFFFWWVIKCGEFNCVKTCARVSPRVAWLCYETRYVSIYDAT